MPYRDPVHAPIPASTAATHLEDKDQQKASLRLNTEREPAGQFLSRSPDGSSAAAHAAVLSSRIQRSALPGSLMHLQRSYGNRYVRDVMTLSRAEDTEGVVGRQRIQTKMTVSQPGDRDEVEAEQTARAVMLQEQKPVEAQRQPETGKEEEDKNKLQASRDPGAVARQVDKPEEEQPA